jgi:hypothetical protein
MKFIKAELIDTSKLTMTLKVDEFVNPRLINEGTKFIMVQVETLNDEIAIEEFIEQQKNK